MFTRQQLKPAAALTQEDLKQIIAKSLHYIIRKTIFAIVVCLQITAVVYVAVASATSSPSTSAHAGQSADAFLHSVYDRYMGPQDQAPFIDYTKERELQRYFEPSLAKIIAEIRRAQQRRAT